MDTVVFHSKGSHHLGRDGGRVGIGGLNGCHTCCRVRGELEIDKGKETVRWQ